MSAIPQPVVHWIVTNQSSFAQSLLSYKRRTGSLSEKQIAAVEKILERDKVSKAGVSSTRPQVKVDKLMDAFNAAIKNGFKFVKGPPRLRFSSFKASLAPATGANPGGIYVNANDGAYLGKIVRGEFVKTRDCSEEMVDTIVKTMDDPLKAAIEYGKATIRCSCCGIKLTNKLSQKLGIGPICKKSWGL